MGKNKIQKADIQTAGTSNTGVQDIDMAAAPMPAKPWRKQRYPRRILAIRLQAMGDVMISLPYLQYLRRQLPPEVELDFLTRQETEGIPKNVLLFNRVISVGGGRNFKKQMLHALLLFPSLFFRRYELVIDLQNNHISRHLTKALLPKAWSLFDRYSPRSAGERYRLTIEAAGLGPNRADMHFQFTLGDGGAAILKNNGWNGEDDLVLLNPAGAFETRHWPMENYVAFARLWLRDFPDTRFLVLGTSFIAAKTGFLKEQLGDRLISLVEKTSPEEAFSVLQSVRLVLSEDSGLMHMAWTSGIPTMVLFGSTRSDWSRPLGPHTLFLDSADLPCGQCMQSVCRLGDNRCMTHYTPEVVFRHCSSLLQKVREGSV